MTKTTYLPVFPGLAVSSSAYTYTPFLRVIYY